MGTARETSLSPGDAGGTPAEGAAEVALPRRESEPSLDGLGERYMPLVRLGESGHAISYLALDVRERRHVVVRVPGATLLDDPGFAPTLRREADDLLRVRHPYLVRVLDVDRGPGTPFYVVEYVAGASLSLRRPQDGSVQSVEQVYEWLRDASVALDFVHGKRSTHREVRPGTILFGRDERARLTDFVVSRTLERLEGTGRAPKAALTHPEFVAPEVVEGGAPTPASDLWSLAATVVWCLVGRPPGTVDETRAALVEVLTEEGVSDVLRALAPDPAARWTSCYEFARHFGAERKRARPASGSARLGFVEGLLAELPALPEGPEAPALPAPERAEARRIEAPPAPVALPAGGAFPAPAVEAAGSSLPVVVERRGATRAARGWVLRLGARDEHARTARDGGFVGVDWTESEPPPRADGSAAPRRDYGARGPRAADASALRATLRTADASRFFHEVAEGDLVVVPNPDEALVHVGRVTSGTFLVERPDDGCPYLRRRWVRWDHDVSRHDLPLRVALTLDGPAALAAVEVSDDALASLSAATGGPGRSDRAALLRGVATALSLAPEEDVRELVRALLGALGFAVAAAEGGPRDLWRLTGVLSAGGLADVPARAWVRAVRDAVGSDVVQEAREELRPDERGIVATLGTFTAPARAAAGDAVRLVDGETLAALAIEHWDRLPPRARDALGVRRSERTTVEVRFQPL